MKGVIIQVNKWLEANKKRFPIEVDKDRLVWLNYIRRINENEVRRRSQRSQIKKDSVPGPTVSGSVGDQRLSNPSPGSVATRHNSNSGDRI